MSPAPARVRNNRRRQGAEVRGQRVERCPSVVAWIDIDHDQRRQAGDIIDQLPEAPFGLSESWDDLRNAHDQAVRERDKRDFKTWLKETKGAVISAKRIQTAFDKLDELPPELRQLLDEIEIAVDIASLG